MGLEHKALFEGFDIMAAKRYGLIFNVASDNALCHPSVASAFAEITAEAPREIVTQLAGRDRVHVSGADSEDALRRYRLGNPHTNKTSYAMVGDDGRVHSAIYVKRDTHDVSEGFRALNGDVRSILAAPVAKLSDKPTALMFYSISNITEERGMGQLLVRNMHAHLTQEYKGVVLSTLSPLRTLDAYLEEAAVKQEEFAAFSAAVQRRMILFYLMSVADPVQKFHMGNGAIIGDIKLGADTVGKTAAMVNYVYPADREELSENAKAFKARAMEGLVAPSLVAEASGYNLFKLAQAPAPQAF